MKYILISGIKGSRNTYLGLGKGHYKIHTVCWAEEKGSRKTYLGRAVEVHT
jgi:hypothetical protein